MEFHDIVFFLIFEGIVTENQWLFFHGNLLLNNFLLWFFELSIFFILTTSETFPFHIIHRSILMFGASRLVFLITLSFPLNFSERILPIPKNTYLNSRIFHRFISGFVRRWRSHSDSCRANQRNNLYILAPVLRKYMLSPWRVHYSVLQYS